MRALRVLSLAFALCACAPAAAGDEKSRRGSGGVEIRVGQERKVEGGALRIAFERVSEDSRCPEGVQCIQQGNARAHFAVTNRRGECVEFELNTSAEPSEYRFGEYAIRLAKLAPHPTADGRPAPRGYRATVVVSKTKK